MAGHRTLDPGMVVRAHRGQLPVKPGQLQIRLATASLALFPQRRFVSLCFWGLLAAHWGPTNTLFGGTTYADSFTLAPQAASAHDSRLVLWTSRRSVPPDR